MSDNASIIRQLKIKNGSAKRLLKEHSLYRNEATEQKIKLDKLVATGAESWDIKNGQKMLEESNKMIDDSATRLGKAVGELRELLVSVKGIETLSHDPEVLAAEDTLEMANT